MNMQCDFERQHQSDMLQIKEEQTLTQLIQTCTNCIRIHDYNNAYHEVICTTNNSRTELARAKQQARLCKCLQTLLDY